MSIVEDIHWWFVARRLILQRVLKRFVDPQPACQVLEVGCGSGGNLEMLDAFGKLHAIELDDEMRRRANARKLCEVRRGKLPTEIPFDHNFDLICLFDVLEHIEDDTGSLEKITSILTTNGLIALTVPAYTFLWSGHDILNHHVRRYTKEGLKSICTKAGLNVRYSTYFNTILFPVVAATRFWSKFRKKEEAKGTDMPNSPINSLLKKLFASERFLLPMFSFPFGVSILLICEKKHED